MPPLPLRVLSLIPPMTQLNTPYPSPAYLTGFLRSRGVTAFQADLALGLVLRLFSPAGLSALRIRCAALPARKRTLAVKSLPAPFAQYLETNDPAVAFLQGRPPTRAPRHGARTIRHDGHSFQRRARYVENAGGVTLAA